MRSGRLSRSFTAWKTTPGRSGRELVDDEVGEAVAVGHGLDGDDPSIDDGGTEHEEEPAGRRHANADGSVDEHRRRRLGPSPEQRRHRLCPRSSGAVPSFAAAASAWNTTSGSRMVSSPARSP